MKIYSRLLFVLFAVVLVSSCSIIKKGEMVILKDATPPAGYNPSFITGTKPFDPNTLENPDLTVSYVDSKSLDSTTKVYMHLVDNNKWYVAGASDKRFMKYWCNVYVTYDGKRTPVKNFKLREIVDGNGLKNAVAIAMDHSGSMGDERALAVQKAVAKLIDKKRDQDAFALIRYDHRIVTEVPLTDSKRLLSQSHKINGLAGYNGFTAIVDASYQAVSEMKGKKYDNYAVMVFTDGFDNSSKITPDSLVSYGIANRAKVFGVDFGENINPDYIKNLSERTGGYYRRIYRTEEFDLLFDDMYYRLNNAYVLELETENYGKHFVEIEICLPKDTLVATSFFDNTPDIGQISLLKVNFDFNKSTLKGESKAAVSKLSRLMKAFPTMEVELRGHTDSLNRAGDEQYNIKLSQERADAVRNELIKNGIEASRIKAVGYGERQPIADNSTEEGRMKNRRTEFIILKK